MSRKLTKIWYANDKADAGTPWRVLAHDGTLVECASFTVQGLMWSAFKADGFDECLPNRPRGILITAGVVTCNGPQP